MIIEPTAKRTELAYELYRWHKTRPGYTYSTAFTDADTVIKTLIASKPVDMAWHVLNHPLIEFVANTFIVHWKRASQALYAIGALPPQANDFIQNGDFKDDEDHWTFGSGWSVNHQTQAESDGAVGVLSQQITGLTIGTTYVLKLSILHPATFAGGGLGIVIDTLHEHEKVEGHKRFEFVATSVNELLQFEITHVGDFIGAIDHISLAPAPPPPEKSAFTNGYNNGFGV